jgi:hypothetical protein
MDGIDFVQGPSAAAASSRLKELSNAIEVFIGGGWHEPGASFRVDQDC